MCLLKCKYKLASNKYKCLLTFLIRKFEFGFFTGNKVTQAEQQKTRKRQARGEARIKSLLEAAETVFARDGYGAATTNEISLVAEVSPATFYQFFPNKEAVANALAIEYSRQLAALQTENKLDAYAKLDVEALVSALMNPLLKFHSRHPAFLTLMLDAPLSQEVKSIKHAIGQEFTTKMATLFRSRSPALSNKEAEWTAEVTMIIYKGFLPAIATTTGAEKQRAIDTFKSVLGAYLRSALTETP